MESASSVLAGTYSTPKRIPSIQACCTVATKQRGGKTIFFIFILLMKFNHGKKLVQKVHLVAGALFQCDLPLLFGFINSNNSSLFFRINISEVHRVYQILEEEDNIKFMTIIEAATTKNETNSTKSENEIQAANEESSEVSTEDNTAEKQIDQNQVLIKTETRTGYVNIDGTERDKAKNETSLSDIVKERITSYYNSTDSNVDETKIIADENDTKTTANKNVEVDDIIVAEKPQESERIQPPSTTRAKEAYKLLPKVIQEFLNNDWKSKSKCEPQHMLERIRKENRYPDHIDVDAFEYLLTPAPSFLQRISLAGEFLSKKQIDT